MFVFQRKSVPPCGFVSNRITFHCVFACLLDFSPLHLAFGHMLARTFTLTLVLHVLKVNRILDEKWRFIGV